MRYQWIKRISMGLPRAMDFSGKGKIFKFESNLLGDLKKAITAAKIHFGLYFSQMDWFHPLYLGDAANNRTDFPEVCQLSFSLSLD